MTAVHVTDVLDLHEDVAPGFDSVIQDPFATLPQPASPLHNGPG